MPPTHDASDTTVSDPATSDTTSAPHTGPTLSRRAVVAGAGAAAIGAGLLVAGCSSGSGSSDGGTGGGSGSAGGSSGSASGPLGPATDVPVGSAKIYGDQSVVVTQASAGNYAGFSTRCPHQGCNVNEVQGASIVCPCHGSTFALDGAVEKGPARTGLTAQAVKVENGQIVLG